MHSEATHMSGGQQSSSPVQGDPLSPHVESKSAEPARASEAARVMTTGVTYSAFLAAPRMNALRVVGAALLRLVGHGAVISGCGLGLCPVGASSSRSL